MKRQTSPYIAGEKPGQERFALPVSFENRSVGRFTGGATSATIGRHSVTVHHPTRSVTVPLQSYRGVAVRMVPAEGQLTIVLELNHTDPSLTVPIAVADDPVDVAQDWKSWSQSLNLPMLLFEADGSITRPVTTLGPIEVAPPKPRRMHSYFASRRPRFLARRKTGWLREQSAVGGAEIIARD